MPQEEKCRQAEGGVEETKLTLGDGCAGFTMPFFLI